MFVSRPLTRSRAFLRGRRLAELGAAIATIAILPATILILWSAGWYTALAASPAVESLVGQTEGRVWKIEPTQPTTGVIHVSSRPLGIGAIPVVVNDDTLIRVGAKEGALGDLHEGVRVRVTFERRDAIRLASSVEVVGRHGPTRGAGQWSTLTAGALRALQ